MEEVHPETMMTEGVMVEVAEILEIKKGVVGVLKIKKGVAKVQERKKEAQKWAENLLRKMGKKDSTNPVVHPNTLFWIILMCIFSLVCLSWCIWRNFKICSKSFKKLEYI